MIFYNSPFLYISFILHWCIQENTDTIMIAMIWITKTTKCCIRCEKFNGQTRSTRKTVSFVCWNFGICTSNVVKFFQINFTRPLLNMGPLPNSKNPNSLSWSVWSKYFDKTKLTLTFMFINIRNLSFCYFWLWFNSVVYWKTLTRKLCFSVDTK